MNILCIKNFSDITKAMLKGEFGAFIMEGKNGWKIYKYPYQKVKKIIKD